MVPDLGLRSQFKQNSVKLILCFFLEQKYIQKLSLSCLIIYINVSLREGSKIQRSSFNKQSFFTKFLIKTSFLVK